MRCCPAVRASPSGMPKALAGCPLVPLPKRACRSRANPCGNRSSEQGPREQVTTPRPIDLRRSRRKAERRLRDKARSPAARRSQVQSRADIPSPSTSYLDKRWSAGARDDVFMQLQCRSHKAGHTRARRRYCKPRRQTRDFGAVEDMTFFRRHREGPPRLRKISWHIREAGFVR